MKLVSSSGLESERLRSNSREGEDLKRLLWALFGALDIGEVVLGWGSWGGGVRIWGSCEVTSRIFYRGVLSQPHNCKRSSIIWSLSSALLLRSLRRGTTYGSLFQNPS